MGWETEWYPILGKTAELVGAVETAMDRLDIAGACNALPPFIEALNNWYIRRSRERFWRAEKDAEYWEKSDRRDGIGAIRAQHALLELESYSRGGT